MMMPLLDFLNHDPEPNVVVLPEHDRVNDQSYVYLKALRDIKKDEQLLISYG
jgi:SET domain-containing protein